MRMLATRGPLQSEVALDKVVAPAPHRVRPVKEDDKPLVVHLRIGRCIRPSSCPVPLHLCYLCFYLPIHLFTSWWFSSHLAKARNLLKTAPSR